MVSNLLQMGTKFSLPDSHNKVYTIKEFIKDIKSCSFRNKIDHLIKIRNIAIPDFHRFLHNMIPKRPSSISLVMDNHWEIEDSMCAIVFSNINDVKLKKARI